MDCQHDMHDSLYGKCQHKEQKNGCIDAGDRGMCDFRAQFVAAMRASGVNINEDGGHPIADGKLHRAHAAGKRRARNNHVWYTLHGDEMPSGAFGDFQLGISGTWCARDNRSMTAEEREVLRVRAREEEIMRKMARLEAQRAAAFVAGRILEYASPATSDHPYLKKKGLQPTRHAYVVSRSVRYHVPNDTVTERIIRPGTLFIPAFSQERQLVGGQTIGSDGQKYFIKGTQKTGSYHPMGPNPYESNLIIVTEGWATAARIFHITGQTVVAAFDAGNLAPVARGLKARYGHARFFVAADNDRDRPVNTGVDFANAAANACGGGVIVPQFPPGDNEGTDFDDLAQSSGDDEVLRQILAVIDSWLTESS